MGHRAMVFQLVCLMMMIVLVMSQRTFDNKIYNSELPEGCPNNTQKYLEQYGYLNPEKKCTIEDIESGLRMFQTFSKGFEGLEITGKCDEKTKLVLKKSRCGCEDIVKFDEKKMMPNNLSGPEEYNIGTSKWPKKQLTWIVTKYPKENHNLHLMHGDIDDAMQRALDIWADVTTLSFKQVSELPADINIRFEAGRHTEEGPYYDFDGQGNVLAHAFFPTSGQVHFDDDEHFVLNSDEGTELFIVAAHEFGHTLGISHSNNNEALMAPFYRYSENLKLHWDDVAAVQALYGRRENGRVTPKPKPPTSPVPTEVYPKPDYCNLRITASFSIESVTYIFTRERIATGRVKTFVYKVTSRGLEPSSRRPIEEMFQRLDRRSYPRPYPYKVDAAVYIPDRRKIYLFRGTRAYRYSVRRFGLSDTYMLDTSPPDEYPRWMDVSEFPERPRAAVAMPYSNYNSYYMLIFGTTMVWDWNLYSERVGAWAYPINVFGRNMPEKVDGAYLEGSSRDGNVIFFKGERFYKFDVRYRRVLETESLYYVKKDFYRGECA